MEFWWSDNISLYYRTHGPYYGVDREIIQWVKTSANSPVQVVYGVSGDPNWLNQVCGVEYIASGDPMVDIRNRKFNP